MSDVSKHESVLKLAVGKTTGRRAIPFIQELDEDEEPFLNIVMVHKDLWNDMGCPETITVTVEPGDRLNMEGGMGRHTFMPDPDNEERCNVTGCPYSKFAMIHQV